jgi:hypothetical protein
VYSDEVWTGIEYQVAASLIYDGWVNEGLKVVEAVRDRYAGFNRNPWDEEECGHHYARAMASWALLPALSGFEYDGVTHHIGFRPVVSEKDFSTFWSCGSGWGAFRQTHSGKRIVSSISLLHGALNTGSVSLRVPGPVKRVGVRSGDQDLAVHWTVTDGSLTVQMDRSTSLVPGQSLTIDAVSE